MCIDLWSHEDSEANLFFQTKTRPGWIVETPRADTGDYVCRSRRYQCLIVLTCQCNLFMVAPSWSQCSRPLIFVDNSPNMHNTCFFPDCLLLSVAYGSIWISYLARYSEIFKKPNLEVVKWRSTFIWKMLSPGGIGNWEIWWNIGNVQSMVCFWILGLIGVFLLEKTTFPRMRKGKRLEFQGICTREATERGQHLGEHQRGTEWGQETKKTLRTILWYKRACIMQKHAPTFSRRHQPLQRTSTKISL